MKQTVIIIGSGIGGLATAIRLAAAGHRVTVHEKNTYPGGKLSEMRLGDYRFDKGPSLLTLPQLIEELVTLANFPTPFKYNKLKTVTSYFFEDGTRLSATDSNEFFAEEIANKLGEKKSDVLQHLKKSEFYFNTTADLFIKQSLSKIGNFINWKTLRALLRIPRLHLFSTMHAENSLKFKNKKTTQIFNRYATYNGSNPFQAPALLNMIPHLELNLGAYLPENGMIQITNTLYAAAKHLNVKFEFNSNVEEIVLNRNAVTAIKANNQLHECTLLVSDADIHSIYRKLLPAKYTPKKHLEQEKSSSAYVFFWGINRPFPELDLHNIFFTENYEEEFRYIFQMDKPFSDPTVYINITSKYCKADAPAGKENWFVMINVPHNKNGKKPIYSKELRQNVIDKINRILKTNIEDFIEQEEILDPFGIESQTSSLGGSLYGNSSNNRYSAFLRHSNYSSKIKNFYFVGGSVHPGGGIPLCLYSAKIVAGLIKEKSA